MDILTSIRFWLQTEEQRETDDKDQTTASEALSEDSDCYDLSESEEESDEEHPDSSKCHIVQKSTGVK